MAPKPASTTGGKAPASTTASKAPATASKAPAAAKKTSKKTAPAADGEKKKRKKARKETYSSYIYKSVSPFDACLTATYALVQSAQAGSP